MASTSSQPAAKRRGVVAIIERARQISCDPALSEHVIAPLRLCFPGGGIEPGESESVDSDRREVEEELGVVAEYTLWKKSGKVRHTAGRIHIAWWSGHARKPQLPDSGTESR